MDEGVGGVRGGTIVHVWARGGGLSGFVGLAVGAVSEGGHEACRDGRQSVAQLV